MRLVDHADLISSWPAPTADQPWRVLISGCMAGWGCGVDGSDYGMGQALADILFPWILTGLLLAMIALLLFAFGLIAQQGNMIQQELWRMKQDFTVMKLRQTGGDQFPAERERRRARADSARGKELEAADGHR